MRDEFKSMRRNSQTAVVEWTDLADKRVTIHAAEWWNGEGIDFEFITQGEQSKRISLHMDDLHAITGIALAFGMLDLEEAVDTSSQLKTSYEKREKCQN